MATIQDTLTTISEVAHGSLPAGAGTRAAGDAALYLAHTETGASIRALAEAAGTHPSTVLRAVRRVEQRRDDPLIDDVLARMASRIASGTGPEPMAEEEVARAARRFLRRLTEPGAFLLLAPGQEQGGIFCTANEHRKPIAMMPVETAAEFAKREWIRLASRGSATLRYRVTEVGRAALRRLLVEKEEARRLRPGFAEAATPFQAQHRLMGARLFLDPESGEEETRKVNLGESPLGWLSRRRGPDGRPFLDPDEIEAGERLRQDFEAASMGPSVAQDWEKFLTPGISTSGASAPAPGEGGRAARERVTKALGALGPGLSDIAFRVCCFLEGIESCERRMGWAARSGKVVLKIALQRLSDHYGLARLRH